MKLVTVVGARPQFIKAAPMSRALRQHHTEVLVHTGQHYDYIMSNIFFDELDIPVPDVNLDVGSGSHGVQTAQMLEGIERVIVAEKPDWVLVYGDTNSTLAGALAASKLGVKVAHIEAGLRSFNRAMPEEINRVLTDHVSDLLLCPSETALGNLSREGIVGGVHMVGDVMTDSLAMASDMALERSGILARFGVSDRGYLLATVHRAENTDNADRLEGILTALNSIQEPIVFLVHPRTRKVLQTLGYSPAANIRLVDPVGYLDMVMLERSARMILTDSGGVQKEAYWLGVPCLTLRDETEWVETVEAGWNRLVGANSQRILEACEAFAPPIVRPPLFGDGRVAGRCVSLLAQAFCNGASARDPQR